MLQRRNDKIVPRLEISFDAKTLEYIQLQCDESFSWKKRMLQKKKELIHIGIAPLSIKVSESRKSKSGLEKKTLLLFLSTTAFSNWRGKPSSAKHKLHPNGFCLYLIPRKKSQTKSRLMSSVFVYIICTVYFEQKFYFLQMGRREWPGASACFAEWRHR